MTNLTSLQLNVLNSIVKQSEAAGLVLGTDEAQPVLTAWVLSAHAPYESEAYHALRALIDLGVVEQTWNTAGYSSITPRHA
jgi:hypothetical protein